MDALAFCLASWREPRVLAALRRDFPLLFAVPSLLAGQALGELCGYASLPLLLWGLYCTYNGSLLKSGWVVLIAGVISGAVARPTEPRALPGEEQSVLARVVTNPRYPRIGSIQFDAEIFTLHSDLPGAFAPFKARCKAIDLPWRNANRVTDGAEILIRAKFIAVSPSSNPFTFNQSLRRDGVTAECKVRVLGILKEAHPSLQRAMQLKAREFIVERIGEMDRGGLLLSMGFGVRDAMSEQVEWAFKATGLAHLLVVSGYQVSIVFGVALWILQSLVGVVPRILNLSFPITAARFGAFSVAAAFVFFVGFESSTVRAALGLLFFLVTVHWERRGGMLNAILVSITLLSLIWPGAIFDPGVQLTYAALSGILIGMGGENKVMSFMAVSFFATASTALVALLWFGNLPLIGFVLNPLLAPLLGVVSCQGGWFAILFGAVGIDPNGALLHLVSQALERGADIVRFFADLPGAAYEPQGLEAMGWIVALGMVLGIRVIYKFNQWVICNGLDHYATLTGADASNQRRGSVS
jgi:ComEC/Rec2-related protein